ncbi:unnamed protein product [Prorocentrum cordatum]|uniref:EF-hand domain-containing protein n=1 Tax=Prorocentrum cordatum TaxID=2364126 RepID=A0ABN9PUY8_9DINO|nr:unnamed protein product [Polarella glacialis]
MNMLIGILVQVVSVVSESEQRTMSLSNLRSRMSALFNKYGVDSDSNKCISRGEFEILLTIPEAVKCMAELGVDVVSLVDYTDFIFEHDRELSFPDMFNILQQLRSGNNATVRDIVDLRQFVSRAVSKTARGVLATSAVAGQDGHLSALSPSMRHIRESVRHTLASK